MHKLKDFTALRKNCKVFIQTIKKTKYLASQLKLIIQQKPYAHRTKLHDRHF